MVPSSYQGPWELRSGAFLTEDTFERPLKLLSVIWLKNLLVQPPPFSIFLSLLIQLHVLSYSLHYLLQALSSPPPSSSTSTTPSSLLTVGDLDPCLHLLSEVLVEDLFGAPAEERECGENVTKIPESKSPQSLASYEIVARFLSPGLVPELLSPVKEVGMVCEWYSLRLPVLYT